MWVGMIANFTVILGHAGFALRDHSRCILQLAHALLFRMIIVRIIIALLRSLNNRVADLLALFGDFIRFQVGQGVNDIAKEGQDRQRKKLLKLHD